MDGSVALNALALVVSAAALATSFVAARRQLRLTHHSNLLPIVLDLFKETRTLEFSRSMEYIRDRLAADHPAGNGYRNLPEEVKVHIRRVGLFYDDVGKLVAHDIVGEQLILGAYGNAISRTWDTLAPYVYAEREKYRNLSMVYFEDLAYRAGRTTMQDVHAAARLRTRPPVRSSHRADAT
ncbi:hypothetical protein [Streptomyces sp. NBC_01092]|uniref:DUF4760 domain-containing protein n=1 Tax=Streptomyces sp. NBC_01092 TaxID=2903748 RepID=UPI00386E72E2|nr:hypothetical protein OG254_01405 [Streptomyces sp. NBC_01092]